MGFRIDSFYQQQFLVFGKTSAQNSQQRRISSGKNYELIIAIDKHYVTCS